MNKIEGRAWRFGDHVNTDLIFPGKYTYTISELAEMARHAMEDADPDFARNVQAGDLIVAGENFGCGSSREQAVVCLKAAGVAAVIAKSFARIYFRNAINLGFPIVQCPEAVEAIQTGDIVAIDFSVGHVRRVGHVGEARPAGQLGQTYSFPPLPAEVVAIVEAGGLVEYVRRALRR